MANMLKDANLMSLPCALSFADEPRLCSPLQAPADTMEELYEALSVIAKAYREAAPTPQQSADAVKQSFFSYCLNAGVGR